MREKKPKAFATEADLCAAFIKALPSGWTPYAECCGWDLLLVRDLDGFQIGVQAKLKLNAEVINQALEESGEWHSLGGNPDCRAVMVPADDPMRLGKICAYVGLTVIRVRGGDFRRHGYWRAFEPELPKRDDWREEWHETAPVKRCKLPEYVPDVRAGSKSPLQLTEWKIKAIKIAVLIERRGAVNRKDFAHFKLDHRRWLANGWLKPAPRGWEWDAPPNFKRQHPKVYKQIAADFAKWAPPVTLVEMAEAARLPL